MEQLPYLCLQKMYETSRELQHRRKELRFSSGRPRKEARVHKDEHACKKQTTRSECATAAGNQQSSIEVEAFE
eukprot:3054775-Amphidinium_carterae.1